MTSEQSVAPEVPDTRNGLTDEREWFEKSWSDLIGSLRWQHFLLDEGGAEHPDGDPSVAVALAAGAKDRAEETCLVTCPVPEQAMCPTCQQQGEVEVELSPGEEPF